MDPNPLAQLLLLLLLLLLLCGVLHAESAIKGSGRYAPGCHGCQLV
jgi:hypothetical protein